MTLSHQALSESIWVLFPNFSLLWMCSCMLWQCPCSVREQEQGQQWKWHPGSAQLWLRLPGWQAAMPLGTPAAPFPSISATPGALLADSCLWEQQALSEETWGIPTGKEENSYPPGSYSMHFTCQWQPKTWSPVSKVKQAWHKSMPWHTEPQGFEGISGQQESNPWAKTMSSLPCSGKFGVWSKWTRSPDPIAHTLQLLGCTIPWEGNRKGKVHLCPAVMYERKAMTKSFFPQFMPYNLFYKITRNCTV